MAKDRSAVASPKARLAVTIAAAVHDELLELAGEMEMTVDDLAEVCIAAGVASYRDHITHHSVKLPLARRQAGKPDPDGGRAA